MEHNNDPYFNPQMMNPMMRGFRPPMGPPMGMPRPQGFPMDGRLGMHPHMVA